MVTWSWWTLGRWRWYWIEAVAKCALNAPRDQKNKVFGWSTLKIRRGETYWCFVCHMFVDPFRHSWWHIATTKKTIVSYYKCIKLYPLKPLEGGLIGTFGHPRTHISSWHWICSMVFLLCFRDVQSSIHHGHQTRQYKVILAWQR